MPCGCDSDCSCLRATNCRRPGIRQPAQFQDSAPGADAVRDSSIESPRPLGDHDRREAIANGIASGDRHRQEAVHAEDQREAFDRKDARGRDRRREDDERAARHCGRALRREQHEQQNADLVIQGDRHAIRVSDEHHAHRHEDRRAVEIKC